MASKTKRTAMDRLRDVVAYETYGADRAESSRQRGRILRAVRALLKERAEEAETEMLCYLKSVEGERDTPSVYIIRPSADAIRRAVLGGRKED